MSLKLSEDFKEQNKLTEEKANFDKTLGKVLFLFSEPAIVFEDYLSEDEGEEGVIKSRPTDTIKHYEVNVYSEGLGKQIEVKMPAETNFEGLNFEDEVKLTERSVIFWSEKEKIPTGNGQFRMSYSSGLKWNAEGIEKANKSQSTAPKTESKK